MTPTKRQLLQTILEQAGEVAERYYQTADALYAREQEFHDVVAPALKAATTMTGIRQADLARTTGMSAGSWIKIFTGRAIPTRRAYITAVRLITGEIQPNSTANCQLPTPNSL
jgi:hypothetical protein